MLYQTSAAKEDVDFAVALHVERICHVLVRDGLLQLRRALTGEHRLVHYTRAGKKQ